MLLFVEHLERCMTREQFCPLQHDEEYSKRRLVSSVQHSYNGGGTCTFVRRFTLLSVRFSSSIASRVVFFMHA